MAGRDREQRDREHRGDRDKESRGLDEPPNSRLFILCQKGTTEQEFRETFEEYGTIEDVWIIKDKKTNEDRGIVYIKFSKTSEAMRAMEEMNGKALPGTSKGLKVVVANSKRDGSTRDPREDERLVRLFVIVPKSFTDKTLQEEFGKFGELENVTVLKDRGSGESKGFGYVRFYKPLHAALAYENCDSSFRPKFAEPQRSKDEREEIENHGFTPAGQKRMYEDDFSLHGNYSLEPAYGGYPPRGGPPPQPLGHAQAPRDLIADYPTASNSCRLIIQAPVGLTQGYLVKLFGLIPGMEYCDLNEQTGIAYARYNNSQCAAYARDKLNGFEYPLGSPLHVQLQEENARQEYPMNVDGSGYGSGYGNSQYSGWNHQQNMGGRIDGLDDRHKAAMVLEKAGLNPHSLLNFASSSLNSSSVGSVGDGRRERVVYTSISLPPPQPTVSEEGKNMAQRLFIVCQPSGVSERVLKDAFCRFGNLIDVYLLSGRNYGYAKFSSKDSALKAIDTLHGQTIAGQKLKVLEAEPPKAHPNSGRNGEDEGPSKKQRL